MITPRTMFTIACDAPGGHCPAVMGNSKGQLALMERSRVLEDLAPYLKLYGWHRVGRLHLCPDCYRDHADQSSAAIGAAHQHEPLFPAPPALDVRPTDCRCHHITPGVRPHPHACPHGTGEAYAREYERLHRAALEGAEIPGTQSCVMTRAEILTHMADAYDQGSHDSMVLGLAKYLMALPSGCDNSDYRNIS